MDLREFLETYGISNLEFAETIGVHPNTVTNWLKYRTFPGACHIKAVEDATKGKVKFKDWLAYKEIEKKYG